MQVDSPLRLLVFTHHAIQYQVPLFRELTRTQNVTLRVIFSDDTQGQGAYDPEFGIPVTWDIPLLEGYDFDVLPKEIQRSPLRLAEKIRASRPTAIVIMLGYLDPLALEVVAIARALGIPVLWRTDANDRARTRRGLKKLARGLFVRSIYGLSDGFLAIGERNREHYRNHGVAPQRIFRSPYNIDDELFEQGRLRWQPERDRLRREHGLSDEHFLFIFTGKFLPNKDPLAIVRAAAMIGDQQRVAIALLGTGELFEQTKRLASELLPGRSILPGFVNQSELPRYYAMADAAVLASHAEAWGLVVNEAQLFSLPIVASDKIGAEPDLIVDGKTAYVFPAGDVKQLSEAMRKLAQNPAEAKRLGENGRRLVLEHSTKEACRGIVTAALKVSRTHGHFHRAPTST